MPSPPPPPEDLKIEGEAFLFVVCEEVVGHSAWWKQRVLENG